MVDFMCQFDAFLAIDVFKHIYGFVAACTIVGLLVLGILSGELHLIHGIKELVSLTRAIIAVGFVGQLLEVGRQLLFCTYAHGACGERQEYE